MFSGRSVHTLDAKGRLSIPAIFRAHLVGEGEQAPTITHGEADCLTIYPHAAWDRFRSSLEALPWADPNSRSLRRYYFSGATQCPIDKQGRILIPPALREHAGLEREVVIAGMGSLIEIWDKVRFDANLQETRSNLDEISSLVANWERR
ncbi:MAG: division/cell wall cluster transcriptional repressor MraZ [Myxococcales bacterium]|nr:division/cell wall cluster transcriptional repressor MraZ [Myxococcales bacterium]